MTFKTQPWGAEFLTLQKPCQVIGIRGFLKYAFVWSVDDDGVFGIHEFTTGNFIASGHTLDQAQKNAETVLRSRGVDIENRIKTKDQINSMADYGFSRKPE